MRKIFWTGLIVLIIILLQVVDIPASLFILIVLTYVLLGAGVAYLVSRKE